MTREDARQWLRITSVMMVVSVLVLLSSSTAHASEDFRECLPEICEEYGISECLIEALILTESSCNPNATSSCGAVGLCQIMPQYHTERMERLGVTDLYDAESNIRVACDYIMELARDYQDVYLVLTAYHSGEYSDTFQKVLNGGSSAYADRVLELARELEVEKYGG